MGRTGEGGCCQPGRGRPGGRGCGEPPLLAVVKGRPMRKGQRPGCPPSVRPVASCNRLWQDEPHSLWGTLAGADLTCVGLRIVPRVLSLCRAAFGSWRLSDPGSESFSDRPRRVRSRGEAGSAAPRGPRWWARAFAERAVPSGLHGEGQRDWGKAWASAGLLLRPACVRQSVSCCCFVIS